MTNLYNSSITYDNTSLLSTHTSAEAEVKMSPQLNSNSENNSNLCYAAIRQVQLAADFLNQHFNFDFIGPELPSSSLNLDCSVVRATKYESHCPFVKSSKRCLTLQWADNSSLNRAATITMKEYQKQCKDNFELSITCSSATTTHSQKPEQKRLCDCMAQKRFKGIYAELYAFCYYLYLEAASNQKKNIKYLKGALKEDEFFNHVYRECPLSIVEAPTGSGKTHQAVRAAIKIIMNEPKVAILAFPTRKLLTQTEDLIKRMLMDPNEKKHLGNANSDDISVYSLTLAEDTRYGTLSTLLSEGIGRVPGKSRKPTIFLTLHAYFRNRGDTPEITALAALILKESKNIWLVIDEAHLFVNSCTWRIPYESMLITKQDSFGLSSIIPWSIKDLSIKNLLKIEILKGVLYRSQEDQGGKVWKLNSFGKHNPINFDVDFEENSEVILNTTTSIKRIRQKNIIQAPLAYSEKSFNPHENLLWFETQVHRWIDDLKTNPQAKMDLLTPDKWVSFLLSVSYRPCVVSYAPYDRKTGQNLNLKEYAEYHQKRFKSKIEVPAIDTTADEDQKVYNLIFPKGGLPFTSDITGMNMFPVFLATKCSSCIFISATLQDYHSKFIRICLEQPTNREVSHFYIDTNHDRILDNLIIVITKANWFTIFKKNFWKKIVYIFQQLSDFYTIGFCENNKQAEVFYDWLHSYSKDQVLILSANEIRGLNTNLRPVKTEESVNEPSPRLSITSAMGTMGTGINMPERKFILFNMGLYKPISAFWHCDTAAEAQQFLIQDLLSSVQQTLGRNMRRSAKERNKEMEANRVTILMGAENFPGFLAYLEVLTKKSFKNVTILDLSEFERIASNISKKKGNADDFESEELPALDETLNEIADLNEFCDSDARGLTRIDLLRLKTVRLLSNWLQGLFDEPLNRESFVNAIKDSKLLLMENYPTYVVNKIKNWLEKKDPSIVVTRRVLIRKFNLNRETPEIQEMCENLFLTPAANEADTKPEIAATNTFDVTNLNTNRLENTVTVNEHRRKDPGRKKGSRNKTPEERAAIQAAIEANKKKRGRPLKQIKNKEGELITSN